MRTTSGLPQGLPSGSCTSKFRVLLVDDHELVRFGTSRLIEAEPDLEVCGEAEDAPTALQLVRSTDPQLAIIDLSLKQGNGLDLVREIKQTFPSVLTIVCSMHDEALYAPRALRAGARGYVSKQQSAQVLIDAIRQVRQGKLYLSPDMTGQLLERAAGVSRPRGTSPLESLSDRELQVFELVGEGLTVREIAERLYVSPKTVEFHRERIRDKLQLPNNTILTRHAIAWGGVINGNPSVTASCAVRADQIALESIRSPGAASSTGLTSTETLSWCSPPPRNTPRNGTTSL
jgi:DNA-binding NarL/FixJ family response regulator